MNLLEKKKIVAEWMGWKIGKQPPFPETVLIYRIGCFPDTNVNVLEPEYWRIEEDRNAWPELWDNMDAEIWKTFLKELEHNFILTMLRKGFNICDQRLVTASPEICLDALVKAIQQKEDNDANNT